MPIRLTILRARSHRFSGASVPLFQTHALLVDVRNGSILAAMGGKRSLDRTRFRPSGRHIASIDHVDRPVTIGRCITGEEGKQMCNLLVGAIAPHRN